MTDKKETVSLEELVVSNMWEIEALINVLERKGVITKDEILNELKELKSKHDKKIN